MSSSEIAGSGRRATVATARPERYGKQLVSHLGRRNGGEWSTEDGSGWIDLGSGRATLLADEGGLHLTVVANEEDLSRLQDVLASHLIRFGDRDELHVSWTTVGDENAPGQSAKN
jgi:hypothetical protein